MAHVAVASTSPLKGVTVEKVLVGDLREKPQYVGENKAGRFPYDARLWVRLQRAGPGPR